MVGDVRRTAPAGDRLVRQRGAGRGDARPRRRLADRRVRAGLGRPGRGRVASTELARAITTCERRADDPPGDPTVLRFREAVDAGALPFTVQGPENALCLDGGRTIGWEMARSRLRPAQSGARPRVRAGRRRGVRGVRRCRVPGGRRPSDHPRGAGRGMRARSPWRGTGRGRTNIRSAAGPRS